MPTPLIGASQYPQVRAVLDPTLDAAVLPDAVLAMPPYVPAAIREVLARDPTAEARTDAVQVERVQNAAVYYAAARAVWAVPLPVSEQYDDYRYTLPPLDRPAREAELRRRAEAELGALLEPASVEVGAAFAFNRAPGRRGR